MSLIDSIHFHYQMVAQKSLSTHQKAFLFLKSSSFTRKRLQPFGPPFCPQKKAASKGSLFMERILLAQLINNIVFKCHFPHHFVPNWCKRTGLLLHGVGTRRVRGYKASGGSDILVTKLRRYRCYAYSILWVSKLPIYRRLGQACERRARLLEESRARKKPSNNPLNPHPLEWYAPDQKSGVFMAVLPLRHFSPVEFRCKCGCGAGMEKDGRRPAPDAR